MRELLIGILGVVACLVIVAFGVPIMVFGTLWMKGRTK